MSQLGIFCTVARTELLEKVPNTSDETLLYLNHAIKQAYNLGIARSIEKIRENDDERDAEATLSGYVFANSVICQLQK